MIEIFILDLIVDVVATEHELGSSLGVDATIEDDCNDVALEAIWVVEATTRPSTKNSSVDR